MGKPAGKKSAYTFFVQHEKEIWQEEHPGDKIVFGDFMRECGAKWKTLDADTKKPFETKAAADAKRWQEEMADYEPPVGSGKKRKQAKDPNAPKRPLTAFFLYAADHRAKVREELGEGCTVGDISKKIGKQWAEIDDDEKQKYQDQAAKNKAQYEKDLEAYHAGAKRAKANGSDGSDDY